MFEKDWAQFEPKDSYSAQVAGGNSSSKPNPLVQLDPGLFIWTIITFLLVLFLLSKFAWKPLLKVLQEREDEIKSSLKDVILTLNLEQSIKRINPWISDENLRKKQIQEKVIDLTFSISEKVIKKNLNTDDNQKIIKDSLKSLEKFDA